MYTFLYRYALILIFSYLLFTLNLYHPYQHYLVLCKVYTDVGDIK